MSKAKGIKWAGDLEDDCSARWRGMFAHCERLDGGGPRKSCQTWFVYVGKGLTTLLCTADIGGSVSNGPLARAICEAIMRANAGGGR